MRCEQCGNEFDASPGEPCPRCGHSSQAPPPEPAAGDPPPPPAGPPRDGLPWETERSLWSLVATLKGVLLEPTSTFRRASREGSIGWALLFWVILAAIGGFFQTLWQTWLGNAYLDRVAPYLDQFPEFEDYGFSMDPGGDLFLNLILMPVYLLLGLVVWFIWTGIVHLLLMLLGGANRGYEATFRVLTYGNASAAIFQIVPFCGPFVGGIWSLVVQILGLKEIHETSGGKAAGAVLGPVVLCCACGILAFVFFAAMIGWIAGQA